MQNDYFTKNWIPINDTYYRLIDVYDLSWDIKFDVNMTLKAYLFGGIIACLQYTTSKRNNVLLYSPNGIFISKIYYEFGKIVSMGWTSYETLLFINSEGNMTEFSLLGSKIEDYKIADVKVHIAKIIIYAEETYITVLTTSDTYILRKGLKNTVDFSMNIPLIHSRIITCHSFYNKKISSLVTIISASNQDILTIIDTNMDALKIPINLEWDSVNQISSSFDGELVALLLDIKHVWCGSYDFKNTLFVVDCCNFYKIQQIEWCGDKAIIIACGSEYYLCGNENDYYGYFCDSNVRLVSEIDGTRIISQHKYSFLQVIPNCLERVYMLTNDPSSGLLDAYNEYQSKSYKTIELVEKLSSNIEIAILNLIDAACYEWDVNYQKMLLKAATYGRSFHKIHQKDIVYKTCQKLRITNNLRKNGLPIPITLSQMKNLKSHQLLRSLILRKSFTMAYEICQINDDDEATNYVITSWASDLIRYSKYSENEIAEEILKILSINRYVPITSILNAAIDLKKNSLSIMLVEYNSSPELVVSTLLKIGNINKAIKIAVDSGDIHIINSVILYMRNNIQESEFLLKLSSNSHLSALGVKFLNEFHPDLVISLLKQEDRIKSLISFKLKQSAHKSIREQQIILKEIIEAIKQKGIMKNACISTLNLFEQQANFDAKLKIEDKLIGCSIIETISKLCKNDHIQEAQKLKFDFNVPEARFYWTCIKSLAKASNWAKIHSMYEAKKNVLSLQSYCEILIEEKAPIAEIERYLNIMTIDSKCQMYIKANELQKASYVAIQCRNEESINKVLMACKKGEHDQIIATLTNLKSRFH